MDALDDAVDKYRGYGVRLQFYFQSVSQLRKCFPDGQDQTLLSNVSQVFFGINDLPTAEYVSNRLGEATIVVTQRRDEHREHRGKAPVTAMAAQFLDRMRATTGRSRAGNCSSPKKSWRYRMRIVITFTPGVPPIWTTRIRYFEERNLARRPGRWERFKAMANVVSRVVDIAADHGGFLVMVCTGNLR